MPRRSSNSDSRLDFALVRRAGAQSNLIASALLGWFRSNARNLPWRQTKDPYAIWVSEVMLQQTQVRTVIPYWQSWMKQFPTVAALARASETTVLKAWEGLGYYRRARNLHAAARGLLQTSNGVFPRNPEAILALPGIGRYTMGAVASIAFNLPVPILDGNVSRVLSRLFAIKGELQKGQLGVHSWEIAKTLVSAAALSPACHQSQFAGNCSALNQSLMELGAMICTVQKPRCDACPLKAFCDAHQLGKVQDYPSPRFRPKSIHRYSSVFLIFDHHRNALLMQQRSKTEINAGFWELPAVEDSCKKASMLNGGGPAILGFKTTPISINRAKAEHSITRFRFHLSGTAWHLVKPLSARQRQQWKWIQPSAISGLPVATAHRKILAQLLDQVRSLSATSG